MLHGEFRRTSPDSVSLSPVGRARAKDRLTACRRKGRAEFVLPRITDAYARLGKCTEKRRDSPERSEISGVAKTGCMVSLKRGRVRRDGGKMARMPESGCDVRPKESVAAVSTLAETYFDLPCAATAASAPAILS